MVLARQPRELQLLLGLVDHQQPGAGRIDRWRGALPLDPQRQGITGLVDQAQGQGDHQRLLVGLARGGGGVLAQLQFQHPRLPIPVPMHMQHRRARLVIPAPELGKGKAWGGAVGSPGLLGRIFHGRQKVVAGGRGAVVTAHIERHSPHERLLPQQGVEHADQLRTLFIDRCGVEIID